MDYEKKYKEAFERAKKKYAMFKGMKQGDVLEDVFPELKESEDERIIDRIIHALHGYVIEMSEIKEAITWLEKQGEQKLEEKPLISLKDFQDAFELKAKQYNIELPNRGYDIHAMCKELYSLLIQQKQEWSEEQIKVLDKVIRNPHLSTDEYNGLIALKEQLKTQKGESV